jgi:hypothetical protein
MFESRVIRIFLVVCILYSLKKKQDWVRRREEGR